MQNKEFSYFIRKFRVYILLVMLLSVIGPIWYILDGQKGYSDIKFMVINNQYSSNSGSQSGSMLNERSPVVSQMNYIYSDDMMNFLIKKFDLYNHYHIRENSEDAYIRLQERVIKNIHFFNMDNGIIKISFNDKSARLAADILNSILENLEKINKSFLLNRLYKEIAINQRYISDGSKYAKQQKDSLKNTIERLAQLQSSGRTPLSKDALMNIQLDIYKLTNNIESNDRELIKAKTLQSYETEFINDNSNPVAIRIINKAYPKHEDVTPTLLLAIFVTLLISTVIFIFSLYNYTLFKEELRIIFGR